MTVKYVFDWNIFGNCCFVLTKKYNLPLDFGTWNMARQLQRYHANHRDERADSVIRVIKLLIQTMRPWDKFAR